MKIFVIMPFRSPFEEIYQRITSPAIEKCGFRSVIVKDQPFVGPIIDKIRDLITESSICVADLTETNANVMFEVGIALTLAKPVIFITQADLSTIPFDIRHHRVISYSLGDKGLQELYENLVATLKATVEFGESPVQLLRQMLVPSSIANPDGPYIVAASPLSSREASPSRGGWKERPLGTYSDHVGIRGLMQSFGLIFGLHRLPELLDPDDFADEALQAPSNLYSIASPKSNRLTASMMKLFFEKKEPRWEFKPDPDSSDLRNPKVLIRLDGRTYNPVNMVDSRRLIWDFGLVIRGPHPADPGCMFMIMAGRSTRGTEASCLAVTDPECLEKLNKRLKDENIQLDNHKHAFCAVVSICAKGMDQRLGPDKSTFRVEDLSKYR